MNSDSPEIVVVHLSSALLQHYIETHWRNSKMYLIFSRRMQAGGETLFSKIQKRM
jgi:hypothetical protein